MSRQYGLDTRPQCGFVDVIQNHMDGSNLGRISKSRKRTRLQLEQRVILGIHYRGKTQHGRVAFHNHLAPLYQILDRPPNSLCRVGAESAIGRKFQQRMIFERRLYRWL
ncbi:hypothetical protein [Ruegeria arenilitoris]|uniref:hypothetical protein n=1 Tax=Ruegeria arenilitoris TaxID=1173585 RepID=UPI001C2C4CCB|nr:hypothetical protein [Ruegeria arenilitoris]